MTIVRGIAAAVRLPYLLIRRRYFRWRVERDHRRVFDR